MPKHKAKNEIDKLDPLFGPAFFAAPKELRVNAIVDYPLPPEKADELQPFLTSQAGIQYKAGFHASLCSLRDWLLQHDPGVAETASIKSHIDSFYDEYLDYTGSDEHQNIVRYNVYRFGPQKFAVILAICKSGDVYIPHAVQIVKQLIDDFNVCGPAAYTHILCAELRLLACMSTEHRWVNIRYAFCQQLAKELILQYHQKYKIDRLEQLEKHYINAITDMASTSLKIPLSDDEYTYLCNKRITETLRQQFNSLLNHRFTGELLIDTLLNDYFLDTEMLLHEMKANSNSASENYLAVLNGFGTDPIFNMNHIMTSDRNELFINWDANYQLFLSLSMRLSAANVLKIRYTVLDKYDFILYSLPGRSIRFSYVMENKVNGLRYPLISYIINYISNYLPNDTIQALLKNFDNASLIVLLKAANQYLNSREYKGFPTFDRVAIQTNIHELQIMIINGMAFENFQELIETCLSLNSAIASRLLANFSRENLNSLLTDIRQLSQLINIIPVESIHSVLNKIDTPLLGEIKCTLLPWLRSVNSKRKYSVISCLIDLKDTHHLVCKSYHIINLEMPANDRLPFLYKIPIHFIMNHDPSLILNKISRLSELLPITQRAMGATYLMNQLPHGIHIGNITTLLQHLKPDEIQGLLLDYFGKLSNEELDKSFFYPQDFNILTKLEPEQQLSVVSRMSPAMLSRVFTLYHFNHILESLNQQPSSNNLALLICLLKAYQYRRSNDIRDYTSWWGRFFGYSRSEKLSAAGKLETAMMNHDDRFFSTLSRHDSKILNRGNLGCLYRAFRCYPGV